MISHDYLLNKCSYNRRSGIFTLLQSRYRPDLVGKRLGYVRKDGRRIIKLDGVNYRASRLAWFYVTGEWPKFEVDHKNNNNSDDRFSNLREATSAQNKHNTRGWRNRKNRFKGVQFRDGGWHVRICINYKTICLGTFASEVAAARRYDQAAVFYFGKFAKLNFLRKEKIDEKLNRAPRSSGKEVRLASASFGV